MTLPNILTFLRLCLAMFSFVLLMFDWQVSAASLLTIAILLDVADGIIARKHHLTSKSGIYLDIMADKIIIISSFLFIGYLFIPAFFFLGILMLLREYMIDTMRTLASLKQVTISADKFSKIKGVLFMIAMLVVLWNHALSFSWKFVDTSMTFVASLAMVLAYTTLIRFFVQYNRLFKD